MRRHKALLLSRRPGVLFLVQFNLTRLRASIGVVRSYSSRLFFYALLYALFVDKNSKFLTTSPIRVCMMKNSNISWWPVGVSPVTWFLHDSWLMLGTTNVNGCNFGVSPTLNPLSTCVWGRRNVCVGGEEGGMRGEKWVCGEWGRGNKREGGWVWGEVRKGEWMWGGWGRENECVGGEEGGMRNGRYTCS